MSSGDILIGSETAPSRHKTEGMVEEHTEKGNISLKSMLFGEFEACRVHPDDIMVTSLRLFPPNFNIIIKNLPQHIILCGPAPKNLE